jgi:WD40 repeat protein
MGNCLSHSSQHHHHALVKGGGGAQDDDDDGDDHDGLRNKRSSLVNKKGSNIKHHNSDGHMDSTETSAFDGTEVGDPTMPQSPDPAATLDTASTTTTASPPTTTTTTTTVVAASSPTTTPKVSASNVERDAAVAPDDEYEYNDYDDDDDGVEAALRVSTSSSSLIAPHKRTDDSPGTEQPAVTFSLSEDVASVKGSSGNSNNLVQHRRTTSGGHVVPSKAFSLGTGQQQQQTQLQQPPPQYHQNRHQHQQYHHHTRQGRALQARLQKARYMQMAMMNNSSNNISNKLPSPGSTRSLGSDTVGSFSSIPEDDDDYQVANAGLMVPLRYSMSTGSAEVTAANNHHNNKGHYHRGAASSSSSLGLNEEFEANMSKGMIWAEVERDNAVLAVALSRQKPTLRRSTPPPLFLAVGTENGSVTVTELLDDSSLSPLLMSRVGVGAAAAASRLGSTVSLTRCRGGRIRSLDFSPNGNFLAVAGDDCTCAILRLDYHSTANNAADDDDDYPSLQQLHVVAEIARVDRIYAVQFSPNGAYLAIGGFDGNVAIVSMEQQQQQQQPHVRGGRGGGGSTVLAPVILREIPCDGLVLTLDWSPDGQYLAIGMTNKTCVLVDVTDSWQVVYTIRRPASVQTVQWHPNGGRYLAIGSNDVVIIDRETLTIKHELDVRGGGRDQEASPSGRQQQQQRSVFRVNNVCWSPNGSFLVTNGSDNKCKLLETKAYTTIHEIRRTGITSVVWGQQNVIAGIPHRYLVSGIFITVGCTYKCAFSKTWQDLIPHALYVSLTGHGWR